MYVFVFVSSTRSLFVRVCECLCVRVRLTDAMCVYHQFNVCSSENVLKMNKKHEKGKCYNLLLAFSAENVEEG